LKTLLILRQRLHVCALMVYPFLSLYQPLCLSHYQVFLQPILSEQLYFFQQVNA
jgi:hypothetical protein